MSRRRAIFLRHLLLIKSNSVLCCFACFLLVGLMISIWFHLLLLVNLQGKKRTREGKKKLQCEGEGVKRAKRSAKRVLTIRSDETLLGGKREKKSCNQVRCWFKREKKSSWSTSRRWRQAGRKEGIFIRWHTIMTICDGNLSEIVFSISRSLSRWSRL